MKKASKKIYSVKSIKAITGNKLLNYYTGYAWWLMKVIITLTLLAIILLMSSIKKARMMIML